MTMPQEPIKLAVLASGSGTTLQNLIDRIAAGRLNARIAVVIGSKPDLLALKRAADAKIMNFVVDRRDTADVAASLRQRCDFGADIEVLLLHADHGGYPPVTGGNSATSSPGFTG